MSETTPNITLPPAVVVFVRQAERKAFIRGLREAARMARKYGYKPMAHNIEAEADRIEAEADRLEKNSG